MVELGSIRGSRYVSAYHPPMATALKLLLVVALSAVDIFLGVPAGILAGLPAVVVAIAVAGGGIAGAALAIYIGDATRRWWRLHRKVRSGPKRSGWVKRIADRYGAPGLGLLAPFVIGLLPGALLGVSLGIRRGPLLVWLSAGVTLWSVVLTTLAALGRAGVSS